MIAFNIERYSSGCSQCEVRSRMETKKPVGESKREGSDELASTWEDVHVRIITWLLRHLRDFAYEVSVKVINFATPKLM